jgi:hypothetical protein
MSMPMNTSRRPEDYNAPINNKDDIAQLEEEYEAESEIPCAIIGCHQPHKRGRYALLKDGDLSRVGHICGKRLLGAETFTAMQRDFDRRRQRVLREQYISSLSFDPDGALVALNPWNERIQAIEALLQGMAVSDAIYGLNYLKQIRSATEKNEGIFEYWDQSGKWRPVRLQGTKFLTRGWQNYFNDAKSSIQYILRILSKEVLTDKDLQNVVHRSSEGQRHLRVVGDVIDSFDVFCRSSLMSNLMKILYPTLDMPPSIGPIDRTPIQKLEQS